LGEATTACKYDFVNLREVEGGLGKRRPIWKHHWCSSGGFLDGGVAFGLFVDSTYKFFVAAASGNLAKLGVSVSCLKGRKEGMGRGMRQDVPEWPNHLTRHPSRVFCRGWRGRPNRRWPT